LKSDEQLTQVSWRVLVPLVIIGVLVKLAFPALSTYIIAGLIIFGLVVIYRKVFIRGFINRIGARRTNSFLFSEEYEKAVEFADQQIAKNPTAVVAYLSRSTAYIHLCKLDAARADCDAALKLDPKSVYTLNNRAVISLQQDNLPAALADMQQALNLQPDNPILLYGRGAIYVRMGNDEAAQKDFDEAIEIEPDQAATYVGRGHLAFKKGDTAAALDDYQKAVDLSEETHQFSAVLAVAEFAAGNIDAARKRWQALPTTYTHYADPDWQRRVLNWPEAVRTEAAKLVAELSLPAAST